MFPCVVVIYKSINMSPKKRISSVSKMAEPLTKTKIKHKVENENYLINFQSESYIKEEIMIPDETVYLNDEASSTANSNLKADEIPFRILDKDNKILTHKEQICNQDDSNFDEEVDILSVDERSEKLFVETHKNANISRSKGSSIIDKDNFDSNTIRIDQCSANIEVDVISHEESQLLDMPDHSDERKEKYTICTRRRTRETGVLQAHTNDKSKENIIPDKKNYKRSQKQTTIYNYLRKSSRASSKLSPVTNNTPIVVADKDISKTTLKVLENKDSKLKYIALVCPKCSKKEKGAFGNTTKKCQDCKQQMCYECLTCGEQKGTKSAAYYHVVTKCRRKKIYPCEHCSYQGKNKTLLRSHVLNQHSAKLDCPTCGKKIRVNSMRKHKQVCGINVPYLKCKLCPFDSKHKYCLTKHFRTAHKHLKPKQYADIIKKIVEEGEKIKADALNSANGPKENMMSRTDEYKKFIQLYCAKCDKVYEIANHKKEPKRGCRKCGAMTLLQCVKCTKCYPKMRTMYMHLKHKCAPRDRFDCAHCDYMNTSKTKLEIHISRRHRVVAPEDYERCSKCDKRYKHRLDRIKHEKYCHSEVVHKCNLCPYRSRNKNYFDLHMNDHVLHPNNDDMDVSISTDDVHIEAPVSTSKPMSRKERLKVEKLTKSFCQKCNKSIKYVKHSKGKCSKCRTKLTYPCGKCSKVFGKMSKLRIHVIRMHLIGELKKRQQCLKCGIRFTLYADLVVHKTYCVKKPHLQCALCDFKTKYRGSLIVHLRTVHSETKVTANASKRFVCEQCGKAYTSRSTFGVHRRHYCGKQPSLACDHCSYKSYLKYALAIHLKRIHKNLFTDQELKCRYCSQESSNMYAHNIHVANCSSK